MLLFLYVHVDVFCDYLLGRRAPNGFSGCGILVNLCLLLHHIFKSCGSYTTSTCPKNVAYKQGCAPSNILLLPQIQFLCQLNVMEIIGLSQIEMNLVATLSFLRYYEI